MSEVVIDSSVIIDYLRGSAVAGEFLTDLQKHQALATHVVVVAEVLVGARDRREQDVINQAIARFRVLPIHEADSFVSLELLKRHRLASNVGWLDCLIAATCLRVGIPIATLNQKHFAVFPNLQVIKPY